jgi:hypothetical protein
VSRRSVRWLAWSLWTLVVVLVLAAVVLLILNRGTDVEGGFGNPIFDTFFILALLVFPTTGAAVASRRPENPIGWIFVAVGIPWGVTFLAQEYATYTLFSEPGSLPEGEVTAWLATWLFFPPLFAAPALLFLLFPSGRFLTPRWRVVAWVAAVGMVATALASALQPGFLQEPPFEQVVNPFGVEGAIRDVLGWLGWLSIAASIVASAASMLLRLRRARGIERQQLKWIASAAALFALALIASVATFSVTGEEAGQLMLVAAYSAIPLTAGYAILRHRLYDVDVVINRTLVYGAVTALLAGSYLGLVLLLQLAFSPLTEGSGVAVALSTLGVAALFRPARNRVQALVDRRFYRRKYDAQRTLEGFAARLREEVDLDALRGELTGVVAETMQPVHVSLWLREVRS